MFCRIRAVDLPYLYVLSEQYNGERLRTPVFLTLTQLPMVESTASQWSPASRDTNDLLEIKERKLPPAEDATLDNTVWRKFDRRVLPLCTGMFILAVVVFI